MRNFVKEIKWKLCLKNTGEAKKGSAQLPFGGRVNRRGCPKQNLDMRRGHFHKNLLETDCFVPSFEYLYR